MPAIASSARSLPYHSGHFLIIQVPYAMIGSDRCVVKLLDQYLPLFSADSQYFYNQPLEKYPTDRECGLVAGWLKYSKKHFTEFVERIWYRYTLYKSLLEQQLLLECLMEEYPRKLLPRILVTRV